MVTNLALLTMIVTLAFETSNTSIGVPAAMGIEESCDQAKRGLDDLESVEERRKMEVETRKFGSLDAPRP